MGCSLGSRVAVNRAPAQPAPCGFAASLLFLLCLFSAAFAPGQQPQKTGVAVWELPNPQLSIMLTSVPRDDAARYDRLRQYFIEFGCVGPSLEEQPLDKKGHHRNLLCTLPGETQQQIIVAAWYPSRKIYDGASTAWPDAVMLPILYHALSAQPRRSTFLFAEFDWKNGEAAWLRARRNTQPPVAFIGIDFIGLTIPHFWVAPPELLPSKSRDTAEALSNAAWQIARLQDFGNDPAYYMATFFQSRDVFPNLLIDDAKNIPRILVYSDYSSEVTLPAFRKDHDFLAFFLGALDRTLDPGRPAAR